MIELLNADDQRALGADGKMVLTDETRGKTHEVALSCANQAMEDYSINILWSDEDGGYIADIPGRRLTPHSSLLPPPLTSVCRTSPNMLETDGGRGR